MTLAGRRQNAGRRQQFPVPGTRLPDTGYRIPDTGYRIDPTV